MFIEKLGKVNKDSTPETVRCMLGIMLGQLFRIDMIQIIFFIFENVLSKQLIKYIYEKVIKIFCSSNRLDYLIQFTGLS